MIERSQDKTVIRVASVESISYECNKALRITSKQCPSKKIPPRRIVLKSDPSESIRDPADSRLEPDWVEKDIGKEKTWCDPVNSTRSGQRPDCNSLAFFLLHRFNFKKKLTRTIWSKPETRALNQAGSEKYALKACYFMPKPYSVNDTIKKQLNTISF